MFSGQPGLAEIFLQQGFLLQGGFPFQVPVQDFLNLLGIP